MAEITWIKLKTDMFDNQKIKLIEALPKGDTILVIWLKLLATAGKANCNGQIMITESIPMNAEEMATVFNRPLNTVRLALETFKRYGMIEIDENQVIKITNWEKHQNIEGMERVKKLNAERNKKYRERKKLEELEGSKDNSDVSVTSRDGIEKESEEESEKEKEKRTTSISLGEELEDFYITNFGVVSTKVKNKLLLLSEKYSSELIIEAYKKAVVHGAGNKESYVNTILLNWGKEGIKDYDDLVSFGYATERPIKKSKVKQQVSSNSHQHIPDPSDDDLPF